MYLSINASLSFFLKQLDVKLVVEDGGETRQGLVQLTDLEINAEALNTYLEKQPLKLFSGRVGRVEVSVCYEKLLKEGFKITLEEVDVVLVRRLPQKEGEEGDNVAADGTAATGEVAASSSLSTAGGQVGSHVRSGSSEGGGAAAAVEGSGGIAQKGHAKLSSSFGGSAGDFLGGGAPSEDDGTSIIAEWIEQITTQMRVEVKGLRVSLSFLFTSFVRGWPIPNDDEIHTHRCACWKALHPKVQVSDSRSVPQDMKMLQPSTRSVSLILPQHLFLILSMCLTLLDMI